MRCDICFASYLCISTIVFTVSDSRGARKCTYFLSSFERTYSLCFSYYHYSNFRDANSETKRCGTVGWFASSFRLCCTESYRKWEQQAIVNDLVFQSQEYKGRSGTSITRHSELYSPYMQFSVMHRQQNRIPGYMHEQMIGYPEYPNRIIQSISLQMRI